MAKKKKNPSQPPKPRKAIVAVNWPKTKWFDKADLLMLLHISSRTLQNWRSKGIIPFTRIKGKIYYKETDVYELLEKGRGR